MRWLVIAVLLAGCGPQPVEPLRGDYLAGLSLVAAAMEVGAPTPAPTPTPRPDGVPRPADCPDLCAGGVLGDGVTVFDCPTCDSDGDGDPDDRVRQAAAPEPRMRGWAEAIDEQARTGKPILVVVSFSDPKAHAACGPCRVMANYLSDPVHFARFAEYGIPTNGKTDQWQRRDGEPLPLSEQVAPMLVYVPDANDPTTVRQTTGRSTGYPLGFVLSDADTFLKTVGEWIDAKRD